MAWARCVGSARGRWPPSSRNASTARFAISTTSVGGWAPNAPTSGVLEALVRSGAMDSLAAAGESHRQGAGKIARRAFGGRAGARNRVARDAQLGISDMFGGVAAPPPEVARRELRPLSASERLEGEKETLGLYLTGHPIDGHLAEIRRFFPQSIAKLRISRGTQTVAGLVVSHRAERSAAVGETWPSSSWTTAGGRIEAGVFGEVFERNRHKLEKDAILVLAGEAQADDRGGGLKFRAEQVMTLAEARSRHARGVAVRVDDGGNGWVGDLKRILVQHRDERGCVVNVDYECAEASGRFALGNAWRGGRERRVPAATARAVRQQVRGCRLRRRKRVTRVSARRGAAAVRQVDARQAMSTEVERVVRRCKALAPWFAGTSAHRLWVGFSGGMDSTVLLQRPPRPRRRPRRPSRPRLESSIRALVPALRGRGGRIWRALNASAASRRNGAATWRPTHAAPATVNGGGCWPLATCWCLRTTPTIRRRRAYGNFSPAAPRAECRRRATLARGVWRGHCLPCAVARSPPTPTTTGCAGSRIRPMRTSISTATTSAIGCYRSSSAVFPAAVERLAAPRPTVVQTPAPLALANATEPGIEAWLWAAGNPVPQRVVAEIRRQSAAAPDRVPRVAVTRASEAVRYRGFWHLVRKDASPSPGALHVVSGVNEDLPHGRLSWQPSESGLPAGSRYGRPAAARRRAHPTSGARRHQVRQGSVSRSGHSALAAATLAAVVRRRGGIGRGARLGGRGASGDRGRSASGVDTSCRRVKGVGVSRVGFMDGSRAS